MGGIHWGLTMQKSFDTYSQSYKHIAMRREDGIIELRLHTDGKSLVWGPGPHTELGYCFADVAADVENKVVILTGTDDAFIHDVNAEWATPQTPDKWDKIFAHGRRLLMNLLDIEVPVIAALNGPSTVHAEIGLLSDILIGSETTFFSDQAHFVYGVVPGDGIYAVWREVMGSGRAKYFLMTGKEISVEEAHRIGFVNEIVPQGQVLERAWELARDLAQKPNKALRYTRLVFTQPLKKVLLENLSLGLALEGLSGFEYWPQAKIDGI